MMINCDQGLKIIILNIILHWEYYRCVVFYSFIMFVFLYYNLQLELFNSCYLCSIPIKNAFRTEKDKENIFER